MALRIGGKKAVMPIEEEPMPQEEIPVEEPMPEDLMAELPESLEEEPMAEGGGEVDPMTAVYRSPEQGPFNCGNCVYFSRQAPNTCDIVAGPIEADGLCNIFTSASAAAGEPMPEGEPYPVEEEEVMQEPEAEQASEEGY